MKIVGFEPKDNNIKLEDIIVDVHYDRQQRLYAICLRDKNTQNILSDYQYARDKKEAQFTKSMMQDDIRNYLDDSYNLVETLYQDEILKDKDDREFKIWTECTGGYSGQSNFIKIAYVGDNWIDEHDKILRDNILGYLEYATLDDYEDTAYVQMIEIKESERRKGIASALIKSLQNEYKDIDYGFTTDDGTQLLKSLGIREDLNDKTFKFPNDIVKNAMATYWDDRTCKLLELPIEQLVKDNNLLDDEDLQSYHQRQWDNKKASEFLIDQNRVDKMRTSEVPYVVKHKDGKLELGDGRHRVRALYNSGYKYVELPTIIETLCESHKNSLRNAFYKKDDNCINQEIKSENKGNLNEAFIQMNDRFKNLINDCVNTLTSNGINVPTDKIDFRTNDNIRRLGVAYYPKSENDSKYVVGLSNYINDMNDEQVKNVIYHEIGHIIAYEDDFKKGYVYIDNNGDTRISGRTPREWGANKKKLSHHGKVWQDIMQSISKITGQSYQRLANAEDSADFKSATNEKFPYQFECPNCHCKLRYSRKTDFVKNFDKVDNDGEPLWWCGTCKKKTGKKIAFVKLEGSE